MIDGQPPRASRETPQAFGELSFEKDSREHDQPDPVPQNNGTLRDKACQLQSRTGCEDLAGKLQDLNRSVQTVSRLVC